MSRTVFPPKRLSETKIYQFNFLSDLGPTEYVSSAAVAVTVYSGVDPSPSSLLSGITSESGSIVSQQILGGISGVIYELSCSATTSLSQILTHVAYLAVIPDLV